MLGSKKRREVARKIASAARSRYGAARRRKPRPPLDQLVLGLLWRHTSVRRATRALCELKQSAVDWNELRVSTTAEIAAAISPAEWSLLAAERVKRVLGSLFENRNVVSLSFLEEMTEAQRRTFLQSLHEVSKDLADEVLLFSMDAEVLPLSEEVARTCCRLGLVPTDRPTAKSQKALMALWAPDMYVPVYLLLLDVAPEICLRDQPRHEACPFRNYCLREGT